MNLVIDKTRFKHKRMSSWGIGTYKGTENDKVIINFENVGEKKFQESSIGSLLILVDEDNNEIKKNNGVLDRIIITTDKNHDSKLQINYSNNKDFENSFDEGVLNSKKIESTDDNSENLVQYEGENNNILDENIIKSVEGNDILIFNESYIIVGKHTKAKKIQAMYDLTILGDIETTECIVNGSLTINGNAKINTLTCYNDFMCKGDVDSEKIYIGGNIYSHSIECNEIVCDGNVSVQTTININESAEINQTLSAYEGIMGAGKFSATNAVANDYFEFDGDIEGHIVEISTNKDIEKNKADVDTYNHYDLKKTIELVDSKISEDIRNNVRLSENELDIYLQELNSSEGSALRYLPYYEYLFSKLIEVSYLDKITSLEDYLMVFASKKILPKEIFSYESVEHVGNLLLPKAKLEVDELTFESKSLQQFFRNLNIAVKFKEELGEDAELVLNKIFESIGLQYSTVKNILCRRAKERDDSK